VYEHLVRDPGADPAAVVEREGLASIGAGSELEALVDRVIEANPKLVEQFRGGKEGVLNSMVGQVMRETKGRADARRAQELFRARLGAP
jgi:aspartyl-tRNA(Asn)/glutamyl-tRNA(Gln) amidotransferase subunit B